MSGTKVAVALAMFAASLFLPACSGEADPRIAGPSTIPPSVAPPGVSSAGNAILRVKCEAANSRSKISVDGKNLAAGAYRASVRSGSNTASSQTRPAVGDEVEFDFDSDPKDVAAGATAISPWFIQGGRVEAALSMAAGQVIASSGAACF